MLRDINSVKISGSIFWSKLDDRQSFSILRIGIKLIDGSSCFATINNPNTKAFNLIKPGNKIILANAWLDTWKRQDGSQELQLKAYDSQCQFFPRDVGLPDLNEVTIVGTILKYEGEFITVNMRGDRNPKTGQRSERTAKVKIGDKYTDIEGKRIILQAKATSVSSGDRKTSMVVVADYDKINIL